MSDTNTLLTAEQADEILTKGTYELWRRDYSSDDKYARVLETVTPPCGEHDWHNIDYLLGGGGTDLDQVSHPDYGTFYVSLEEHFGGEGLGDNYYMVVSLQSLQRFPSDIFTEKQYFKKPGYHQSYDGSYYDGDLFEVKPVEKTITVYEKVK